MFIIHAPFLLLRRYLPKVVFMGVIGNFTFKAGIPAPDHHKRRA
ncbi:hypothetical protein [Pseudoalteromonas nigrifaciens]|nr:Uncharacterised protein [Pseudoalteromonas nigrifaciens]